MQIPQTCTRELQCFKCLGRGHVASQYPNRRTMILRGKDEYSSEEEEANDGVISNKKRVRVYIHVGVNY